MVQQLSQNITRYMVLHNIYNCHQQQQHLQLQFLEGMKTEGVLVYCGTSIQLQPYLRQ